ncbi:ribonuclease domain-containing protein [Nocardia sp. NPDC050712]|uniref:ribonuclease domain-containing protein n=1 Tax=Nocardia sp. NPDC050712 TaxID=3155518 RepID=UPI0033F0B140
MRLTPVRAVAAFVAVVVVALLAVLAVRGGDSDTSTSSGTVTATSSRTGAAPSAGAVSATPVPGVPDRAYATLREIDAGRWPGSANAAGTQGGEQWGNRERRLPRTDAAGRAISYQEWDVNPKQRNRSRDAERIVTGSDGSAWYTGDHYKTFTRMR